MNELRKVCNNCGRKFRDNQDVLAHTKNWYFCDAGHFWFNCRCGSTMMIKGSYLATSENNSSVNPNITNYFNKWSVFLNLYQSSGAGEDRLLNRVLDELQVAIISKIFDLSYLYKNQQESSNIALKAYLLASLCLSLEIIPNADPASSFLARFKHKVCLFTVKTFGHCDPNGFLQEHLFDWAALRGRLNPKLDKPIQSLIDIRMTLHEAQQLNNDHVRKAIHELFNWNCEDDVGQLQSWYIGQEILQF